MLLVFKGGPMGRVYRCSELPGDWPEGQEREVSDSLGLRLLSDFSGCFEELDSDDAGWVSDSEDDAGDDAGLLRQALDRSAKVLIIEIQDGVYDSVLEALFDREKRKTVEAAIEARLDKIENPEE
jgi:hypothetical protein